MWKVFVRQDWKVNAHLDYFINLKGLEIRHFVLKYFQFDVSE